MLERARSRARRRGVVFALTADDISVPKLCPVLTLPLRLTGRRSDQSPSLDRLDPQRGYVPDNVRVISDRANRLKGDRTSRELRRLAISGRRELRSDYWLIAEYLEREVGLEAKRTAASNVDGVLLFNLRINGELALTSAYATAVGAVSRVTARRRR